LGAAWDALSLAKRRAVVDVLITVTILPTGRGGRAFKPESVRIEWKDDTVT
jgi:site-specific DNA recombinase